MGKNAKLLKDHQEPVHIIMDRATSKTMDAYVELVSLEEATRIAQKQEITLAQGRLSRLGNRPIEVHLSSQAALMKDLFPTAHGVVWDGPRPIVAEEPGGSSDHASSDPWMKFKGFIAEEEMTSLVKHVEVPHRVSSSPGSGVQSHRFLTI